MGSFMALKRLGGGEIQPFQPPHYPPTHTASLAGSGTQPRRLQPPPHTCWRDWRDNRPGCEALIVWDVWEKSIDCVCVKIFKTFWHQFEDFHHFFHRRSSLHVILLLNIQKMTLMTENLQKLLGHLGIFFCQLWENCRTSSILFLTSFWSST